MTPILIVIEPFNPATGLRETIRFGSALDPEAYGLEGQRWFPSISERPVITVELMSPDIDGRVQAARCRFAVSLDLFKSPKMARWKWKGAPVKVYAARDLKLPALPDFDGLVESPTVDLDAETITFDCTVDTSFLEGPLLTSTFDGTGGIEGDADIRGTLLPAGFGSCQNIAPVWFDKTNWIGMIDGYGNTVDITRLTEGLNDFGESMGDYLTYATLKAAIEANEVPPGRWATCISYGLVGLGAPPVKPIGVDAVFGANSLGGIMQRILVEHRDVPLDKIDGDTFDLFDTIVPYDAHYWTADQRDVRDLLEAMAASANATPVIVPQGYVTITRATTTAPVATLDRSGKQVPRVTDWRAFPPQAPVWRLAARVARPASVISLTDVLYEDDIIDRGGFDPAESYRQGHLVWMPDGSSYLYINAVPSTGNVPPVGEESNAFWFRQKPPLNPLDVGVDPGATRNDPAQLLQDAVFSETFWTHGPGADSYDYIEAPKGRALAIAFVDGQDNFTTYGGTLNRYIPVEPGRTVFFRLTADPGLPVSYQIVETGDNVVDGPDTVVETPVGSATWTLVEQVQFYTAGGVPVGAVVPVSTFDPAAGRQTKTVPIIPPVGAFLARVSYGHYSDTGEEGIWSIWSPWQAEYEPAADITSTAVPVLTPGAPVEVRMNYLGQVVSPLPIKFRNYRTRGGADRTVQSAWSVTFPPGVTGTINNTVGDPNRGEVTITAVTGIGGPIVILSNLESVTLSESVALTVKQDPPPTNTGGAVQTYTITLTGNEFNTTAFARIGPEIPFTAAATSAALSMSASFNLKVASQVSAEIAIEAKFQISGDAGATWTDCGPAVANSSTAFIGYEEVENPFWENEFEPGPTYAAGASTHPGFILVNQNTSFATPLTPGLPYIARFVIRRTYGVGADVTAIMLGNGSVVG